MLLQINRLTKAPCVPMLAQGALALLKAGQHEPLQINFLSPAGALTGLQSGSTCTVTVKASKASTEILGSCDCSTLTGQSMTGWLNLDNDAANALPDGTRVLLFVDWTENGYHEEANDFPVVISAEGTTGDETRPADGSAAAVAAWLAAHILAGTNITITSSSTAGTITLAASGGGGSSLAPITALVGGTAGCLDAVPTAAGAVPTGNIVTNVVISGGLQAWQLQAGTGATGNGITRPADYDASANARVWKQIA